jgi:hypothetical protein
LNSEHQIRPTELASLAQFDSKDFDLKYREFRTRKSVSARIGENGWNVTRTQTDVFTVIPFRALR